MSAVAQALLAALAAHEGDAAAAREHLAGARVDARVTARRDRQVVEIASLVVAGERTRAAGLAHEHMAEFPNDGELLARIATTWPGARDASRTTVARDDDADEGRAPVCPVCGDPVGG